MDYWSPFFSVDEEFKKLVLRMNPPRVTVDNNSDKKTTLIKVDSANKRGSMASVYITDEESRLVITDADRVDNIRKLMLYVLKGDTDWWVTNTVVSVGSTHNGRRLHQMMYADRDFDEDSTDCVSVHQKRPLVNVEKCKDKGYTVVTLKCPDRPKLLFDAVCTLTDMQFVVFHATISAEGPEAYQGLAVLTLSSSVHGLKPPCDDNNSCHPKGIQIGISFLGLYLIALGKGGIKFCVSSFGVDQFDDSDETEKKKSSFFLIDSTFLSTFVHLLLQLFLFGYKQKLVGVGD